MNEKNQNIINKSGILNRIKSGTLAVILGQLISVFGQVVTVPLFLYAWGSQLYGEWMVLYSVVIYFSLLDFGIQTYAVNFLTQKYAVGDIEYYTKILHSALKLYLVLALIAIILVMMVVVIAPLEQWFNFAIIGHSVAITVIFFLSVQLLLSLPYGLIVGLYRTFGEFSKGIMLSNFQRLFAFIITAIALIFKAGVVQTAILQLIPFAVFSIFILLDIKRKRPEIYIGVSKSEWKLAVSFLIPSSLFFMMQISNMITLQGSIMLISVMAGVAYVALFSIHRTVVNLIRQAVGALNSALWPEITILESQKKYDWLKKIHRLFIKISLMVSIFFAIWIHFAGKDIISLWSLHKINFDQSLLDWLLIYLIFQTPWLASSLFPAASNTHKKLSICYLLSAVFGLLFAYFFVRYWGINGVVIGLLAADFLICGWFIPTDTCRNFGDNLGEFWFEITIRGLPFVLIQIFLIWLISGLKLAPIANILIVGIAGFIITLLLGYFSWLNKFERENIRLLLKTF